MNELLGREIAGLLFDADGTLLDTYDLILSSMRYTINEGCNENYSDAELMRASARHCPTRCSPSRMAMRKRLMSWS